MKSIEVLVADVQQECEDVKSYTLVSATLEPLPSFDPGAHVDVQAGDLGLRQYSLCNDAAGAHDYRIAVKREASGRGGSAWMHAHVAPGDRLHISPPRNNFRLSAPGARHLLLAGGIGITPLLSMAEHLWQQRTHFELCCFVRSQAHLAFSERLRTAPWADRVRLHFDAPQGPKLNLGALLSGPPDGSQLYMCGPAGFMQAVTQAAREWPETALHCEHFAPVAREPACENAPFDVQLAQTGQRLHVPPDQSLLSVLREAGVSPMTSCEQGVCGTCVTRYLDGDPLHGDSCLSARERQTHVAVCSARSRSALLVLDL